LTAYFIGKKGGNVTVTSAATGGGSLVASHITRQGRGYQQGKFHPRSYFLSPG